MSTYHSFKETTVPGLSDADRGKVHALNPQTFNALCGFTGAYPCAPLSITCQKCAAIMAKAEGGN